jgi:regulator of sirC expression with transglutaminase-like and TPR domain
MSGGSMRWATRRDSGLRTAPAPAAIVRRWPASARSTSYLFDEQQFDRQPQQVRDPRNSCLNEVLDRRTGIPITLSLVYMEVARRPACRSTA